MKHVEMTCLLDLPQEMRDISKFKVAQRSFLRYARNNLGNLDLHTELLQKFSARCALCNQFRNTLKLMKHHWRTQHPLVFESQDENYLRLVESSSRVPGTPLCAYCGKTTKGACHATDQDDLEVENPDLADTPEGLLKCDFCSKQFTTTGGLQLHVTKQHPDVSIPIFKSNVTVSRIRLLVRIAVKFSTPFLQLNATSISSCARSSIRHWYRLR